MIRAIAIALLLAGCGSFRSIVNGDGDREEIIVRQPDLYSRSEIDAINAEQQCRQLARTMLQAQRCGVRR